MKPPVFHTSFVFVLLLSFTASQWSTAQTSQDWPQFRGPSGNANFAEAQTPTEWSDAKNLAWKTKLIGRGASSPIVVGDKVLLTAFSGYGLSEQEPGDKSQLKLHTLCFDRRTGNQLWNQSINASPDEQEVSRRVADHGYASATPVSDGKHVFVSFGVSGVVAYDLDGNKKWRQGIGKKTAGFGSSSSPVVFQDMVLINASIESSTLFALNKATGKIVWQRPNVIRSWSIPCIAKNSHGNYELVLNQKETIYGLDPNTGEQLWSCSGIPDYIVPVPIADDGIVYCLGGRSNRAMAIRLGGRGDVTETHKLWDTNIGANVTSPVLVDDYLFWASDKGIANCMNAKTGESIFRERMPTKARVYASIVRAGDKLYLTTRDNGVQVLTASPEFKQLALNKIESDQSLLNASPAISHDQIFLRSDRYLYCIGKK